MKSINEYVRIVLFNNNEKLKEVMNTYQSRGWDYFIKY